MSRFSVGCWVGIWLWSLSSITAAPPAVQDATTQARNLLAQNRAPAAVALLEAHLAQAEGNREFLDVLREAYLKELAFLQQSGANEAKLQPVRTKLALLGGTSPAIVAPAIPSLEPPPAFLKSPETAGSAMVIPEVKPQPTQEKNCLQQAIAVFTEATSQDPRKYLQASKLFDLAFSNKIQMRPEQLAAWAFCKVKLAADQLARSQDAATAEAVIAEVEAASAMVPHHPELTQACQELLTQARLLAPERRPVARSLTGRWQSIETDSFVVKFQGSRDVAMSLAESAEVARQKIAERWSGPLGGPWQPKCEIVLYMNEAAFREATKQAAGANGHAEVELNEGKILSRKIELHQDDARLKTDVLPRELTYIVLADLFQFRAPPKWAEVGMAVLATSETEIDRHRQTVLRCWKNREIHPVSKVITAGEFPAEQVTGFYVESVSLVEFLVRLKGEKAFTSFLRDSERYGVEAALGRQYSDHGIKDSESLQQVWLRSLTMR